jgi:hypothetical protein
MITATFPFNRSIVSPHFLVLFEENIRLRPSQCQSKFSQSGISLRFVQSSKSDAVWPLGLLRAERCEWFARLQFVGSGSCKACFRERELSRIR